MKQYSKESCLLSLATDKDNLISILTSPGFDTKLFTEPEDQKIFNFIKDYYDKYKEPPNRGVIESEFETEIPPIDYVRQNGASVEYYVDELSKIKLLLDAKKFISESAKKLANDQFEDYAESFSSYFNKLTKERFSNIAKDINQVSSAIMEEHERRSKLHNGIDGIRSPWQLLDEETLGFQNQTITVFAAKNSTGKTVCLLLCAYQAWRSGHRILFASPEMSDKTLLRRLASIHTRINYNKIRKGLLNKGELEEVEEFLRELSESGRFDLVCATESLTMSAIDSLVDAKKHSIVFVDNFYLLKPEVEGPKHEKQASIFESMGRLKIKHNIPVVTSCQINTSGKVGDIKTQTTDALAGTQVIAYNADDIYLLYSDSDLRQENRLIILTLKARDHSPVYFYTNWDFSEMNFTEICKCHPNGDMIQTESSMDEIKL